MSHRREAIYIACFLLIPFLMVCVILMVNRSDTAPVMTLDVGSLMVFRTCLIAFGLINLAMPFLLQRQIRIGLERSSLSPADRELRFLWTGLSYCTTPAIFGFVLFLVGDPMRHAIFGAIASFIGVAAWSYHVLRPKHRIGNQ